MDDAQVAMNELFQTNQALQQRCIVLAVECEKLRKQLAEKEEPK